MIHLKHVTRIRAAKAQFEPFLEIIAIISGLMGLLQQASDLFGFDVRTKNQEPG